MEKAMIYASTLSFFQNNSHYRPVLYLCTNIQKLVRSLRDMLEGLLAFYHQYFIFHSSFMMHCTNGRLFKLS